MACQVCEGEDPTNLCDRHVEVLVGALALTGPVARVLREPDGQMVDRSGAVVRVWLAGSFGCRARWWEESGLAWAGLEGELEAVMLRHTAPGPKVGGRAAETPLPFDVAASDALSELRGVLWAVREEIRQGELVADNVRANAGFIARHVERLRRVWCAGQLYEDLLSAVGAAEQLIRPTTGNRKTGACSICGAKEPEDADWLPLGYEDELLCPRCLSGFKDATAGTCTRQELMDRHGVPSARLRLWIHRRQLVADQYGRFRVTEALRLLGEDGRVKA